MISRREMVTAGMFGTLTPAGRGEAQSQDLQVLSSALGKIEDRLGDIKLSLDVGLVGSTMAYGHLATIRQRLEVWVKSTGRFPEFWDVGISVFLDIYDWHVRHQQPLQLVRIAEQRMAIQWMFTQYVLRWENEPNYIAPQPYDR
jgi:hypothetical protein